jgi:hypothetical protein
MVKGTAEHRCSGMKLPSPSNWVGLIVLVVLICQQTNSYSLTYTDCLSPTAVRRYQYSSMCPESNIDNELSLNKHYTILQKPVVKRIRGHSCQVKTTRFHFKCGAWGHLKMQSVPTILHTYDVSISSCRRMIHSGTFVSPGRSQPYKITLDEISYLEVVEKGSLEEKDQSVSCLGEPMHIGGTLHTNMLVLSEYRVLIREESYLVSDGAVEAEGGHVRLDCMYSRLGCQTGDATYTWDLQNHPCPLEIVRTIEPKRTLKTYLIDHEAQFLVNTTGTTKYHLCPFSLIQTDHPTVFLAETSTVIALPPVSPSDVDTALQSQIHLNYLSYQIEKKFANLEIATNRQICLDQKRKEDSRDPMLIGINDNNTYGLRTGDLYLIFTCESKVGKIREAEQCYTDIPIIPEGFVTPRTRQLTPHSTVIPCSKTFPLVIQAREGWIEFTPKLKVRPAPLIASLPGNTPLEYTDYSHGGLYSDSELQDWYHQISFPAYHRALLKSISYGSCVNTGSCSNGEQITPYDLNNLIPELEKKFNIWKKFTAFLHEYGDLMAFLCLFILGFKFLIDLLMISLTLMKAGPAAAMAMCTQLYMYNRDTYKRIMQRHQKMNQKHVSEQIPLTTTY